MDVNTYINRGRVYPCHTPQHPHRGTGVGGNQTTGEVVTGEQGHQWRMQPRQASDVGTELVASATGRNITHHNADTTRNRPLPAPLRPATTAATPATTPTPQQQGH